MAGGVFKSQNKIRPGAYINFRAVTRPLSNIGTRGIVTLPVSMGWGDTVTHLYSTDLIDGKSLVKIGYSASDPESQIFREALKNCREAVIYRLDSGGIKATADIEDLTITAKYSGIVGNRISVSVTENTDVFRVITYFNGIEQDVQTVEEIDDLVDNDWVTFSGEGSLSESIGVNLAAGTNGAVTTLSYTNYLEAMKSYKWDTMGVPKDTIVDKEEVITFIRYMREDIGKKVQGVLFDVSTNYEGIISVNQGYKTLTETISPETFVAYVAGLTAGSLASTSNTYHAIEGAVSIVYPQGVTPYGDEEIEQALREGKMVLSTRQDGAIVIEQDINTLHTFNSDKNYSFSKNRVIRTLDEINNSIALLFEKNYIGKVDNNEDGRNIFKTEIINYLNSLQIMAAIRNFNSSTDIQVFAGNTIDSVVVEICIQPIDAMEKLYMTVMVG